MPRRVGSYIVNADVMSYVVRRHNRFYVVAYDGLDTLTGRRAPSLAPCRMRPR